MKLLGESVYCEQCDRHYPFGMHVEKTTMLKVPTQEELFLMQLEMIVEKMSAKTDTAYRKTAELV